MRAPNRLHAGLGESEVFHLAFVNQILHRSRDILDWDVWINAMLIQQIDHVYLEAPEGRLDHLFDVRRPTIQTALLSAVELEPELGRNHHPIAHRRQGFADQIFVGERAVCFGRVEERDAAFNGQPTERDHLLFVSGRTVPETHGHTAKSKGRHFQIAVAESALLHCSSPRFQNSGPFLI